MKKTISLLLVLLLILPASVSYFADNPPEKFTSGDYDYVILDDGTAEIARYSGSEANLTIPSELDGHKVTSIGEHSFYYCKELESITIPDSVTAIQRRAFLLCINLSHVTVPDSVIFIGDNPFTQCPALNNLSVSPFHPTLAFIDGVLFDKQEERLIYYPQNLTAQEYEIPAGTKIIGSNAFVGVSRLENVTIPDSVTVIEGDAFACCEGITSITIPDSVTIIGVNPFWGCSSLEIINISPLHPTFSVMDGVLYDRDEKRIISCPQSLDLTDFEIPQGTENIGAMAFVNCTSIVSIEIPETVKSIGYEAFAGCKDLWNIWIPDSVINFGENIFLHCDSLHNIFVRENSAAFQYCIDNEMHCRLVP